jgi:hypothetical protein
MKIFNLIRLNASASKVTFDKAVLYYIFLFFNFLVGFRVLLETIFQVIDLALEAIYLGVIFLYLGYRVSKRIFTRNFRLNPFELLLSMLFLLPFLGGFSAYLEWGQPLLYGIGTFRDFYLIFGALIVYNMLRNKEIDISLVEQAWVSVAWFNMILFYGMTFLVDPSQFQETGAAGANELKGGDVYFRFNMSYMFFGSIYYAIKAIMKRKSIYLLYAALFLIYIVFFRLDRTTILVSVGAIGAFFLFRMSLKSKVLNLLKFGIPAILLIVLTLMLFPEEYTQYYVMFSDIFTTVSSVDNTTSEQSIRLTELNIALEYIEKNPWIGSGKVSGQWVEGGFQHFLGFFFISDIGIAGQVFVYGFIGMIVLYSQFLFALFFGLKIGPLKKNVFLMTCQFFLLALFVDSFSNGYLSMYAAHSINAIMVIYYFYEQDKIVRVKNHIEDYNAKAIG